jgi:quercetin dioxygenase-like cupin family protein
MKVIRFSEAESYEPHKDWKRVSLCNEKNISVEHFVKPPHHESPLHSHDNEQVMIVIKGRMRVYSESAGEQILNEGDAAFFSAGESHVVGNCLDTPSVGIDIFYPGRPFDFWLKRNKV